MPAVRRANGAGSPDDAGETGVFGGVLMRQLQGSGGIVSSCRARTDRAVAVRVLTPHALPEVRQDGAGAPAGEAGLHRRIIEESAELGAEADGGSDQPVLSMQASVL
jgi:hypothetical protein